MANSELFVQDSRNGNRWRPLTTDDLLDNESFGYSHSYSNTDGTISAVATTLWAIHLTVLGATSGDTVTIKSGSDTVLNFTLSGDPIQSFSFTPTVALSISDTLSVASSLTGGATFDLTTVYG